MLTIVPIDLNANGGPRDGDEKLHAAVQAYCKKEFGEEVNFRYFLRGWCVVETHEGFPDYFEVIGVTTIKNTPDVPIFHVTPPETKAESREGLKVAMEARDLMIGRLRSYCEDCGQRGNTALVYVSEKATPLWQKLLERAGLRTANRFEIKI